MGAWEIILIIACALIVSGVIVSRIVRKAKGKPTCDCGCSCKCCSGCPSAKNKNELK
ncbi:MAG: FeoB-associated Cys-rich membrane protein [Clostridia bacterium]|nr:FeoB-associated Cys-rich membrane protein [Clostridia bacterium]